MELGQLRGARSRRALLKTGASKDNFVTLLEFLAVPGKIYFSNLQINPTLPDHLTIPGGYLTPAPNLDTIFKLAARFLKMNLRKFGQNKLGIAKVLMCL